MSLGPLDGCVLCNGGGSGAARVDDEVSVGLTLVETGALAASRVSPVLSAAAAATSALLVEVVTDETMLLVL